MKKLIMLSSLLLMVSCNRNANWKYKIKGQVYFATGGPNPMHDAIWYTDTIYYIGDTVCYDNSDGSTVKIAPPYEIEKL
jgi:hypothetical protein